jgi:hypothetical protein
MLRCIDLYVCVLLYFGTMPLQNVFVQTFLSVWNVVIENVMLKKAFKCIFLHPTRYSSGSGLANMRTKCSPYYCVRNCFVGGLLYTFRVTLFEVAQHG